MKLIDKYLAKWEKKLLLECMDITKEFLCRKYNLDESFFDNTTVKPSRTCDFAKFISRNNTIRLHMRRKNYIYLYERKTLGKYKTSHIRVPFKLAYTSQLIHEFTHFIQNQQGRIYSEVETTRNELEFLEENNIETKWEKK